MKIIKRSKLVILFFIPFLMGCNSPSVSEGRKISDFNEDWLFSKDTLKKDLYISDIQDKEWEKITIPHTPQIEPLVVNNQWQGICWYRKHFTVENSLRNKKIFVHFEGAMQVADVWINGEFVLSHKGGYLPFSVDVSDKVLFGKDNLLAIKLSNTNNPDVPPGKDLNVLDFNYYGGIYRNVKLIVSDKIYVTNPVDAGKISGGGVFVTYNSISKEQAKANVKVHVQNDYEENREVEVQNLFLDKTGTLVAKSEIVKKKIEAGKSIELKSEILVKEPELWHPLHPYLYTLITKVESKGILIDEITTKTGIRSVELTKSSLKINGDEIFLRGTNRHQEYPYVGYAISDAAQYRDAVKIKSAGFDFVRLSHYPQSNAFLDACDELGLVVMNCIPGWQFIGGAEFKKNALQDCRDMIRRDRNHPSVVFWEVSINESRMDKEFMKAANNILDEEMPDGAISAGWIDDESYDLFIPARQHNKPPDYWNNYRIGERPVFIAEYGDWEYYAQNAGFNQNAYSDLHEEERTSRQLRSDGEKRLLQQALNYQEAANSNRKGIGKSTIGHANWLMFDYNRGYADDIESSGISDIFRIPKFSYYFYQSQRPPQESYNSEVFCGPMVYIANYWNSDSDTEVRVFSNCTEVELFLNDTLVARKRSDQNSLSTNLEYPPFTFSIAKYKSGNLKAAGYIEGKEVAEYTVATAGQPEGLELSFDDSGIPLLRNNADIVFLYASVVDEKGILCSNSNVDVKFELLSGNAEIIGDNPVKAEAGIATILLKTRDLKQELGVKATAKNLSVGEISIK